MPRLRACIDCGRPTASRRCPEHKAANDRAREARRGTDVERGYTAEFRRNRDKLLKTATHCVICGLPPTWDDPLTADHIIPLHQGGGNEPENLRPAHRSCNSRRSPLAHLPRFSKEERARRFLEEERRTRRPRAFRTKHAILAEVGALRRIGRRARRQARGLHAAQLREQGAGWTDIAKELDRSVGSLYIDVQSVRPDLITAKRAKGRYTKASGPRRPHSSTPVAEIQRLSLKGWGAKRISRALGVSTNTAQKYRLAPGVRYPMPLQESLA